MRAGSHRHGDKLVVLLLWVMALLSLGDVRIVPVWSTLFHPYVMGVNRYVQSELVIKAFILNWCSRIPSNASELIELTKNDAPICLTTLPNVGVRGGAGGGGGVT